MKKVDIDFSKSEWEHIIDEWVIGKNSERDKQIMKRRLFDGICFEPLAEEFNLSDRHIKTIYHKHLNRIIKNLDKIKKM